MNGLVSILFVFLATGLPILTQDQSPQLRIVKLDTPIYPPMAAAARVWGEVRLQITVNADGTPTSVVVEDGPPMLRQAAEDSAVKSRFDTGPGDAGRLYPLVYQFALTVMKCDEESDPSYPHVKYERNVVSVTGQVSPLCDPSVTIGKVRGPKCLYLWRCSSKMR